MSPSKKQDFGPPESDVDDFVDVALDSAQKEYGRQRVYTAAEHEKFEYGVPLPPHALALRFLVASHVWPLQRLTQSCGRTKSCKSAFMFELEKWFLEAGGIVNHYDTENKTSSSLLKSIIPPRFLEGQLSKRYTLRRTDTLNTWQQMMIQDFEALEKLYAERGRKSFPIFWGVDPLMGSDSEDMAKTIATKGEAPGRTFSDAPRMIWQFLRDLTSRAINTPLTVHFSHHERKTQQGGVDKAGGTGIEFLATIDLRFRVGMIVASEDAYSGPKSPEFTLTARNSVVPVQGKHINIRCRKNSSGPDVNKHIYVPFKWTYDEAPETEEGWRQRSWWDWHTATSALLIQQARYIGQVMDIRQNTTTVGPLQRYYSDALGVLERDKGLPADEFGERVTSDPELLKKLEAALHIQHHPVFTPDLLEVEKFTKRTAKKGAAKKVVKKKAVKKKAVKKKAVAKKSAAPPPDPITMPPEPAAPPPPPTMPDPPDTAFGGGAPGE